jgi:hypothetical protein
MPHFFPSPSTPGGKSHLLADAYYGNGDAIRRRDTAHSTNGIVMPREQLRLPPQQPRNATDNTAHLSSAPSSITATPFAESVFSKYNLGGSGREVAYVSPVRSSVTTSAHTPVQPFAQAPPQQPQPQLQPQLHRLPCGPAESGNSAPPHSPAPRTPPRYSSGDVAGHADLRYPAMSLETVQSSAAAARAPGDSARATPPTQRLVSNNGYAWSPDDGATYEPTASAKVLQSMERNQFSSSPTPFVAAPAVYATSWSSTCWLCEGRCLTGPGSTWSAAPPLFFASRPQALPVSTLTLCPTCAAAVGVDTQATSREVLQRCQRTPAIRYRTSAYVNAVREYKLLLELMAQKVVRACERMRRIHGAAPTSGSSLSRGSAEVCLDPAADVSKAPLLLFSLPLQYKVIRQLLEALEELLQRDGRATQLAAAAPTASPIDRSGMSREGGRRVGGDAVQCSEIMAPRERHVLLEEVAHVERQLMAVSTAMETMAAEEASKEASPAQATASAWQRGSARHPMGKGEGAEATTQRGPSDHVVASPRPSHVPPARSSRSTAPQSFVNAISARIGTTDPLSALADPRRVQRQQLSSPTEDKSDRHRTLPSHGHPPYPQRGGTPSSSRSRKDESPPPLTTSPQRGGRRAVAAESAPFPFAAAPHRDHSHNRSRSAARGGGDGGDGVDDGARAPLKRGGERAPALARQHETQQRASPAVASPGRRAMEAMVGSAMWATYRNESHSPDGAVAKEETGEVAPKARHRIRGMDAEDPENILLNYFAGRFDDAPRFRVSSAHRTLSRRSPRRAEAMVPVAAPDERSLIDADPLHPRYRDRDDLVLTETDHKWQVIVEDERRRRRETEEALLQAHTRIAALEQTTNDMAEELLAHRLSVTFRSHLEGMEVLVGRWTLLAQNYCLQKSLLFAEEAAALVRIVQREAYGIASFLRQGVASPLRSYHPCKDSHGARRSPAATAVVSEGAAPTGDEVEEDAQEELWVSRDEPAGHRRAGDTNRELETNPARGNTSVQRSSAPAFDSRSRSSPSSLSSSLLHTVLPSDSAAAAAPYAFPSEFRLKPLALHL